MKQTVTKSKTRANTDNNDQHEAEGTHRVQPSADEDMSGEKTEGDNLFAMFGNRRHADGNQNDAAHGSELPRQDESKVFERPETKQDSELFIRQREQLLANNANTYRDAEARIHLTLQEMTEDLESFDLETLRDITTFAEQLKSSISRDLSRLYSSSAAHKQGLAFTSHRV